MTIKDIYERCDTINNYTTWYIIDENGKPVVNNWGCIYACLVQYYNKQVYHFNTPSTDEVIVWLE